jgi:hypothetical protein
VLLTFCSGPDATPRIALTGPGVTLGEREGEGDWWWPLGFLVQMFNGMRRCPAGNAVGVVQGLGLGGRRASMVTEDLWESVEGQFHGEVGLGRRGPFLALLRLGHR